MPKQKIGIFSFSGCSGDQLEILYIEKQLLELIDKFDIVHFPLIKEENKEGYVDIAFVEGAITTKEQIEELKKIREDSKFLIAFGTCAAYGGVPTIKNFMKENAEKIVYKSIAHLASSTNIEASGIDKYIKVDYYMRGCPIDKHEFLKVAKELLLGKKPKDIEYPVCIECRKKENPCLLQMGYFCMGPITYAGCDAVCVSDWIPCVGCRGPLQDANIKGIVEKFEKEGITKKELKDLFTMFVGAAEKFKNNGEITRNKPEEKKEGKKEAEAKEEKKKELKKKRIKNKRKK